MTLAGNRLTSRAIKGLKVCLTMCKVNLKVGSDVWACRFAYTDRPSTVHCGQASGKWLNRAIVHTVYNAVFHQWYRDFLSHPGNKIEPGLALLSRSHKVFCVLSMNTRLPLIGWGGGCDIIRPPLHINQSNVGLQELGDEVLCRFKLMIEAYIEMMTILTPCDSPEWPIIKHAHHPLEERGVSHMISYTWKYQICDLLGKSTWKKKQVSWYNPTTSIHNRNTVFVFS